MDLEAAFLEAALPLPITLLHQQLNPYSVGHDFLLRRMRSPLLSSTQRAEYHDLKLGVLICSNTYDGACKALSDPDLSETNKRWDKLIGPLSPHELEMLIAEFELYAIHGQRGPKFNPISKGRSTRPPGAPFVSLLLYTLCRELRFTRTEALNTPYGMAMWMYCVHWECNNGLRITTQDDLDEDAVIKAEFKRRGWERMAVT